MIWTMSRTRLRALSYDRWDQKYPWPITPTWIDRATRITGSRWWSRWLLLPFLLLYVAPRLPELLFMAADTLELRWRDPASPPPRGVYVMTHADGGFLEGFWTPESGWLDRDRKPLRVYSWRHIDGSRAKPWHEDAPL